MLAIEDNWLQRFESLYVEDKEKFPSVIKSEGTNLTKD